MTDIIAERAALAPGSRVLVSDPDSGCPLTVWLVAGLPSGVRRTHAVLLNGLAARLTPVGRLTVIMPPGQRSTFSDDELDIGIPDVCRMGGLIVF